MLVASQKLGLAGDMQRCGLVEDRCKREFVGQRRDWHERLVVEGVMVRGWQWESRRVGDRFLQSGACCERLY